MKVKSPSFPILPMPIGAEEETPALVGTDEAASSASVQFLPDVPVDSFGSQSTMTAFADSFCGNNDGILSEKELVTYAERFGDKVHLQFGIERMATELGMVSTLSNGRISVRPRNSLDVRTESLPLSVLETREAIAIAGRVCTRVGTATKNELDRIKVMLIKLPFVVLQEFERRGCSISVAGLATEAFPSLIGQRPRGYPPGATWDNAGGGFKADKKTVFLATQKGGGTVETLYHELGHAFERTHSAAFSAHYQNDLPKLVANNQTYLTQPGEAGLSEAFAESFARFLLNPGKLQREYPDIHSFWDAHAKKDWKGLMG